MKVLVTGAAGYIGSVVARELSSHHQVRGMDMRPMPALDDGRCMDLSQPDALLEVLDGIEGVAHLAWPMGRYEGYSPREHTDLGTGVGGLFQLLQLGLKAGVKRFIFQSTINITAPDWDTWRLSEDAPPRPGLGSYTLGKTLAEEMCRNFARCHHIEIAVIRFGGVFTLEEEGREFAGPARHSVPGSCVERRDIAQAYHLALTRPLPSPFEVFHIFHARPGARFPIDKARDVLGYEPRYNVEELWRRC